MPVTHNIALLPISERQAIEAHKIASHLRHGMKGVKLADWRKDTRAKLDKMSEPMRGLVAANLNSGAVK